MKVQELIDDLQKIEDKTLDIYVSEPDCDCGILKVNLPTKDNVCPSIKICSPCIKKTRKQKKKKDDMWECPYDNILNKIIAIIDTYGFYDIRCGYDIRRHWDDIDNNDIEY